MTKKHYEAIAKELLYLRLSVKGDCVKVLDIVANNLATYFEQDNPKFDRVRFLTACGIEPCSVCKADLGENNYECKEEYHQEKQDTCECGNKPHTDAQTCKECCNGYKCTYGCGTCFCGCHDIEQDTCKCGEVATIENHHGQLTCEACETRRSIKEEQEEYCPCGIRKSESAPECSKTGEYTPHTPDICDDCGATYRTHSQTGQQYCWYCWGEIEPSKEQLE